ncbi:two pore domain potassium channel family protein [Candidatus Micrarchaeota archaeon CG10_big_fil_rev_8_21_14_0_10_59_7]|nr:MAG: two pore domain potassium channel family protein [Candidatus Micrarchaeota archaeon CG10_big_fil_rev_8_21_14_0_10_59_7]
MDPRTKVIAAIVSLFLIWAGGSVVYHYVEGWCWLDSFYFGATTLTTVGYGDYYPTTNAGKLFTIFFVFIGVAVALYTLTLAGEYYTERRVEARVLEHFAEQNKEHSLFQHLRQGGKK